MVDSPIFQQSVAEASTRFGLVAASDEALVSAGEMAGGMIGQRLPDVVPAAISELKGDSKPAIGSTPHSAAKSGIVLRQG